MHLFFFGSQILRKAPGFCLRMAGILVSGVGILVLPAVLNAREPLPSRQTTRAAIAIREEALMESSGSFLAAMNAQSSRDLRAAATYFRNVLKSDPKNTSVLERAFISELGDGNFPEAFRMAERSITKDFGNPLAQATLGVKAIKQKHFITARNHLTKAGGGRGRNSDLTVVLLTAWTHVGSGDVKKALELVDRFNQPELAAYRNFFGGLMADVGGDRAEASKRLVSAYKSEPGTLRVADAYARFLDREGNRAEALKVYQEWAERNHNDSFVKRQIADLKAGRKLDPLASSVADGAAEVLYGLGTASTSSREVDTSLLFMQLASYLKPDDELVQISIAELFEQMRQWERAGEAFSRVADGSFLRTRALLGRVISFERLEKTDEAIKTLTTLLKESPDELEAVDLLGGLYRTKKKMPESIAVYSSAIEKLAKPERQHWNLFYSRAVSYERNKEWQKAEADFLKALELLPEQPRSPREKIERAQVLNYLAYSWVDQGLNIDRSFDMLKRAVELTPEDGAIVDSLGWAYFRLARYEDATRELERAVELKPGDPTINDHLGDAYWRIGRTREAYFKWNQAKDLKPEADDLPKILRKIEKGLEDEAAAAAPPVVAEPPKANGG